MFGWLSQSPPESGDGRNKRPDGSVQVLELYQYPSCPYCRRVFRAVEGLDVNIKLHDTRKDPEARQRLVDATGRTQVPALFIDGEPMLESSDIVRWLQQHYG